MVERVLMAVMVRVDYGVDEISNSHGCCDSCVSNLEPIKTITKFTNVIGYHQPDLSTNRTVYASCLLLDSGKGQFKEQLTLHACVSGQNASCARAAISHFAELTVFFLRKSITDVKFLSQILP